MNLVTLFRRHVATSPSAPALVWDGGMWSYGELEQLVGRFAALLAARGLGEGARVALLLPNHPAFAVALLGTLWRGAVAAVLSPAWAPADTARALAESDVRLVVTTDALAAATGVSGDEVLIVPGGAAPFAPGATAGPLPSVHARNEADHATILYSSGTTADPRGVVLTHGNLAFNAAAKVRYCGIMPSDRLAMVVPMAHCFGQNVVLLGALFAGASVRLFTRFEAAAVAEAIDTGDVSMLLASPTAFERLLALGDPRPLRKLRYALTAAAPPRDELAARWRDATGTALAQGYGLTECSPFATYDPDASDAGRGVGRAIDQVVVAIAPLDDQSGTVLAEGEGEIIVRGPNVMAGYWRRPEATARALRGGWLHSGDVGRVAACGTVSLLDRVDDVINVAGFKAWPSDVERALRAHPAVLDCAAYGLPDTDRGAAVGASVVLHDGWQVAGGDIMQFAAAQLAGFQRPARLRIVDELPHSASGKVMRRALAASHQEAVSSRTS